MKYLNKIIKGVAILLLIAQVNVLFVNKSYALFGVGDVSFDTIVADFSIPSIIEQGQSILNTASNIASKYSVFMSSNKETFLDAIAYQMSRMMIKQMRDGMIRWIQSGYDGKPSFLVNPEQMVKNMAAAEAKMVLNDVANFASYSANSMSNALIYDIRRNQINTQAAFQAAITPTLGVTIQNNICSAEGFGLLMRQKNWTDAQARAARKVLCENGLSPADQQRMLNDCFAKDFKCGGWNALLDLTQNPGRNTGLGQLGLAVNRVNTQTKNKSDIATQELNRGSGFFNIKECIREQNVTVNGTTEKICNEYQSTSPGQKAVSLMSETVTDPIKQSRLADEINESVSAVASAFMSDLVGRGFKVVNEAVNNLDIQIAQGTNNINNEINKQYLSMDDAIKAFTKPDAITPAPAYNKTNVQVIKMDSSSIANLSRNMIKDMTSVASSNIDYIRTAKNEILLLEPYVNSLNALSACNKNTLKDQTVQDYVDDRMTKVGSMLPVLKLEVVNIPPRVAVLIDSIKFVASSTDVNAIQAVYQAFNQEIDTGALKKSESADVAENKYQQLDIQINGPRDENGTPLAKGEMENKIKPKLLQCGCKANSGFVWEGNSCLSPEEQLRNDNPEAYHS